MNKLKLGTEVTGYKIKLYYGEELENRHILVTGKSGTGKSYCINSMMNQLDSQNVSTIIFDFSGSMATYDLHRISDSSVDFMDVDMCGIGLFDFRDSAYGVMESARHYAQRIADTLQALMNLGPKQKGYIRECCLKQYSYGKQMNFEDLLEDMFQLQERSLYLRLKELGDCRCFQVENRFDWESVLKDGRKHMITFSDYDAAERILLTELLLLDLLGFVEERGAGAFPCFVIVLDEIQRLSVSKKLALRRLLTEGRKFGVGIWGATQSLESLPKEYRIMLEQAATRLEFQPDAETLQKVTRTRSRDAPSLEKLSRGQCLATAQYVRNDGKVTRRASLVVNVE